MKNIKVLFMVMTIMVIAAISFESISTAAQVTRIHSSRKYIFIDGSIADGFVMGATVCFYASSGEEITCGRIEQASESLARVRVDNRIAKQIRNGMEARLSVEEATEEEATASKACTDDSECGDTGYCVNGKCQQ
ncbi:MAG: hypothetical protein JRE92_07060 [Deltaproteobacteria bacterium]|jgi:uncharacterized membrane protein|nr:hypothetical protein [Deltaproteobacteria bacterium]